MRFRWQSQPRIRRVASSISINTAAGYRTGGRSISAETSGAATKKVKGWIRATLCLLEAFADCIHSVVIEDRGVQ